MNHHKLLLRQLRRLCGEPAAWPAGIEPLLAAVSQAYSDADADRATIERSLELMSSELNQRNEQLRAELLDRQRARDELQGKTEEQQVLIQRLEEAHHQLLQSEKMASIGQLAAGVAHEINNPIGFVSSNLRTLQTYVDGLIAVIDAYEMHLAAPGAAALQAIEAAKQAHDYSYLCEDAVQLLSESTEGVQRVRQIVQDLKDFSHVGEQDWQWVDLHKGLDSTLNIVQNEIKYVADVTRCYGGLPEVECLASQLNQVFMNLLVNAAHAVRGPRGHITVRTGTVGSDRVFIEVADEGTGIAPDHLKRVFDPFFTTKPVGKGTGLGLSLSYGIVRKHGGQIEVKSELGVGTTFRIVLPVRRAAA